MIDLSYDFIITLQKEVLRKFGTDSIIPGDCKHLAQSISDETTKLVSETTLKRVFGFATTLHSFSRYTLNTLSQYCNYKDWEDFQSLHFHQLQTEGTAPVIDDSRWTELKSKADAVSHYTILTLKNRSGIPFPYTIPRSHCFAHIERFLGSDYAATAFIAPSGWGKSITLVHLAEHFWFSKEAKYKEDICWFIHAHATGSRFSLASWLDNQLNLGNSENFREYFAAHFDKKGGRLILIIDGFDEISMTGDKIKLLYTKLEEFVYSNDRFPWVKVILSIRSNPWSEFFQHSLQHPAFRRYWYLGPEMDETTNVNLPCLTEQEVKSILYNHRMDPATVRTFSENFLKKLRYPYYLQLFCQMNTGPGQAFVDENLSLFEMISKFVQSRVFHCQNNTFKIQIIGKLLKLLDFGRAGLYTDKQLLLNKNTGLFPAYKELLTDNILVEENLSQEIMFNVKVRFAHNALLEYFTATHFIQESNMVVNTNIMQQVQEQLPASSYRVGVFKWLIRYAINNDQTPSIHHMFYLPLTNMEKSYLLEYLAVYSQHEGDKELLLKSIFPQDYFRKHPLHRFLNDNFVHFSKKKVLNALLELAEIPEDKIKLRSILFIIALLQLDAEQCEQELNNIKRLMSNEQIEDDLWVTPHELYLFIYEYMKFGLINETIKDKIYNYPRYLNGITRHSPSVSMEIILRLMGFAFVLNQDYTYMLNYTQRIFECYPLLIYQKTDPLRLSLLCWQAYAYIGLGNYETAAKIARHTELMIRKYSFDFLNGRHIEVLQKLIQAHIYFHDNELNKAIRTAEAAIDISQKMDFKLFILMGYQLLNQIYPILRPEKPLNQSQQQITLINKSTSFRQVNKLWA